MEPKAKSQRKCQAIASVDVPESISIPKKLKRCQEMNDHMSEPSLERDEIEEILAEEEPVQQQPL